MENDKFEIIMKTTDRGTLVSSKPREELSVEAIGTMESDGNWAPLTQFLDDLMPNVRVKVTFELI